MSGFKDMVQSDIYNVFLNLEEFAEYWTIEGKCARVVVDTDRLQELQNGQDLAVAESSTLFYAKSADLPPRRPAGENLNINGHECLIDSWDEDMGVATVVLRENIVA